MAAVGVGGVMHGRRMRQCCGIGFAASPAAYRVLDPFRRGARPNRQAQGFGQRPPKWSGSPEDVLNEQQGGETRFPGAVLALPYCSLRTPDNHKAARLRGGFK
jgi:hypothetical protein